MSPASGKPTVSITLALQGSLKSVPHPRALGIGPAPMVTPKHQALSGWPPLPRAAWSRAVFLVLSPSADRHTDAGMCE